jgi:hypothetical protein
MIGVTQIPIGAASCPATKRRGKEDFCFRAIYKPECLHVARHGGGFRLDREYTRAFLFLNKLKTNRRYIMSKYNMWQPPQTTSDAIESLDKLSDVIQFIKDLTSQPTPPIEEYDFSKDGYSGFYFFLCFIQDVIEASSDAISQKPLTGDER